MAQMVNLQEQATIDFVQNTSRKLAVCHERISATVGNNNHGQDGHRMVTVSTVQSMEQCSSNFWHLCEHCGEAAQQSQTWIDRTVQLMNTATEIGSAERTEALTKLSSDAGKLARTYQSFRVYAQDVAADLRETTRKINYESEQKKNKLEEELAVRTSARTAAQISSREAAEIAARRLREYDELQASGDWTQRLWSVGGLIPMLRSTFAEVQKQLTQQTLQDRRTEEQKAQAAYNSAGEANERIQEIINDLRIIADICGSIAAFWNLRQQNFGNIERTARELEGQTLPGFERGQRERLVGELNTLNELFANHQTIFALASSGHRFRLSSGISPKKIKPVRQYLFWTREGVDETGLEIS